MANWKEVTERWLPIVEHMEEHSMDDYAIPEIYRAAENAIDKLLEVCEIALPFLQREDLWDDDGDWYMAQLKVLTVIRKHKGD